MTLHNPEHFYPIEIMRRANVAVVIRWSWYEGPAVVLRHPAKKRFIWATRVEGETIWLPRGAVRGHLWPDRPSAWRPADLDAPWPDALPDPLPPVPVRMGRIDAVARREYRLNAAGKIDEPEIEYTGSEWWRDSSRILYQRRGHVSKRMVEGRLMRALANSGGKAGQTLTTRTPLDLLASVIDEAEQATGKEAPASDFRPRLVPTPADGTDWPEAMRWFASLNPPELWHKSREAWQFNLQQRVLIWRSLPLPATFSEIAEKHRLGRRERAFELYHDGIELCCRAANGHRVHTHLPICDRLAELQESNRAAKIDKPDDRPRTFVRARETDPLDLIKGRP